MKMSLSVWYLWLTSIILVKGRSVDESDLQILHRSKRSTQCSSVSQLLKYGYVSGHTACLSASANYDSTVSGVSSTEKAEILTAHNDYRSMENASNMVAMIWDDEAAFIADRWAANCDNQHDDGYKRRIPGRFSLGQNLASGSAKLTWTNVVTMWYNEINYFTYGGSNDYTQVGHYTQVVWAKSIRIGCSYAKCDNVGSVNRHFYVCNYGPAGNVGGVNTPYQAGTPCADCPGHCVNGVCSCEIVCLNGGTLNTADCTCNCITGYSGADCALDCSVKSSDPSVCTSSYTASKCPTHLNVPDECPNMCNMCPNAGIAITGATDGKGKVPFELSGGGVNSIHFKNAYLICYITTFVLLFIYS